LACDNTPLSPQISKMKVLVVTLFLIGLTVQQQTCQFPPLFGDIPSLFNVFIFDNFQGENVIIGGRLAAGYNISLGNGSTVATELLTPLCQTNTTTASVNATESNFFYSIVTNGSVTWPAGTLGSGTIAVGSANPTDTTGITNERCPSFTVVQKPDLINFEFWEDDLKRVSQQLANLTEGNPLNVTFENGTIIFPLDINGLLATSDTNATTNGLENVQIFNVPASAFLEATAIQFGNGTASSNTSSGSSPNLKTIVLNIRGTPCGRSKEIAGLDTLVPFSSKIVCNFIDCTDLQFNNVTIIPGTILAPLAGVTANSPNGTLWGHLFAENFSGSLKFNNTKFEGCFTLD